jgi:hypothetical protein
VNKIILDESLPDPRSTEEAHMFGTAKERLDFYRSEIHFETSILSNRTNAYLGAQSFLVIAYASSMNNVNPDWGNLFTLVVPLLLSVLGLVCSLHAWPGIKAAYQIIDHWYFKQTHLLKSEPLMGRAYDESPLFTEHESTEGGYGKALKFSMRTPWIFSVFWLVLGVFSVYVNLV